MAKLDNIDVKVIRSLVKQGFGQKWVAAFFSVTASNVSHIKVRRTWKHI